MLGRADGISREACPRVERSTTSGTILETGKAEAALAGVGVLHSSEEAPESGVERRRGSSADACETERERGDGPEGIATPTVSETATGVRKLQRTLHRQFPDELLHYQAVNGGKQMKAVMVRYADELMLRAPAVRTPSGLPVGSLSQCFPALRLVVLCLKGQGAEMHSRLKSW